MHLSLCNTIARFASLILSTKKQKTSLISLPLHENKLFEALKEASEGYPFHSFKSANSIPELEECFKKFITMYPAYQSSNQIDQLRSNEYFHLTEPEAKVCLDYCGVGLFSYLQSFRLSESSAFSLSEITANLSNHALYGSAEKGTVENDIKTRIMEYLNTPENEYSLVFTASRGSAFQLLAESYPFENNKKLLTMFDHESQSVIWMAQRAREKGAKVYSAKFRWPTLKVRNSEMTKMLSSKKTRKKDSATGLFVFPVQSRVSGVKYAYKWMALAKQYGWHVLLDAGSLGPKDMDSFGLSLFRPDFIITSFFRVFGSDPAGFGCLLMKKSAMSCLRSDHTVSGMVRIVPVFPEYCSDSGADGDGFYGAEEDRANRNKESMVPGTSQGSQIPVFSGPYMAAQVRDWIENEIDETYSIREIMKSPIFTDDESSDSSLLMSLGRSPFGSGSSCQPNRTNVDSLLQTSWFSVRRNPKRLPPKVLLNNSPVAHDHLLSFDASVLSVPQDLKRVKKHTREEPQSSMIQEETDNKFHKDGLTSEIYEEGVVNANENAIRRETEFEFMLLERREGRTNEHEVNMGCRVSFRLDNFRPSKRLSDYLYSGETSSHKQVDDQELNRREPEIVCRHIDHINMIGINKTSLRLRSLINWFVTSLLHLQLPGSEGEDGVPLVHIYGPKIKHERGAAVAFNIRDRGGGLIQPETVQKLAERNGIHLGVSFLSNIRVMVNKKAVEMNASSLCEFISNGCYDSKYATIRLEVVTASLGFLTNFADVYKMWAFVAGFLDPSFIVNDELSDIVEMSET